MGTLTIQVSESLRALAGELAREKGLTVDQLVASALAEKVSALAGPEWLAARAARADRSKFLAALDKVADAEPEAHDRL